MDSKAFPSEDAYPLSTPINLYKRGFDLISEQWHKTAAFKDEHPGSYEFETYVAWRMNLIIWTCCTIESCVNLEGVSWTGEEFYKDTIERLRIGSKIRALYALKYQECLPSDEDTLTRVRSLFELRNHYVHPKTRSAKETGASDSVNFQRLIAYKPDELWDLVQSINGLFREVDGEDQRDNGIIRE